MQVGFISDSLEIKFLILYIAARVIEPVPFEVLQDLAMCDGGVDYFDFSAWLADLVRTESLSLHDGLYAITKKGRDNSAICESSLPYSVRMQVEKNIAQHNQRLRRNALVTASTTPREKGGYTLTLSLSDELDNVMHLELLVTKEDMAKELEKRFKKNAEVIYGRLINLLYEDP